MVISRSRLSQLSREEINMIDIVSRRFKEFEVTFKNVALREIGEDDCIPEVLRYRFSKKTKAIRCVYYTSNRPAPPGIGLVGDIWINTKPDSESIQFRSSTGWIKWRHNDYSPDMAHPFLPARFLNYSLSGLNWCNFQSIQSRRNRWVEAKLAHLGSYKDLKVDVIVREVTGSNPAANAEQGEPQDGTTATATTESVTDKRVEGGTRDASVKFSLNSLSGQGLRESTDSSEHSTPPSAFTSARPTAPKGALPTSKVNNVPSGGSPDKPDKSTNSPTPPKTARKPIFDESPAKNKIGPPITPRGVTANGTAPFVKRTVPKKIDRPTASEQTSASPVVPVRTTQVQRPPAPPSQPAPSSPPKPNSDRSPHASPIIPGSRLTPLPLTSQSARLPPFYQRESSTSESAAQTQLSTPRSRAADQPVTPQRSSVALSSAPSSPRTPSQPVPKSPVQRNARFSSSTPLFRTLDPRKRALPSSSSDSKGGDADKPAQARSDRSMERPAKRIKTSDSVPSSPLLGTPKAASQLSVQIVSTQQTPSQAKGVPPSPTRCVAPPAQTSSVAGAQVRKSTATASGPLAPKTPSSTTVKIPMKLKAMTQLETPAPLDLPPPVLATPKATPDPRTRHPQFWLGDGSVVLQVDNTLFKLHGSRLMTQSPLLETILSADSAHTTSKVDDDKSAVTRIAEREIYDGCPVYELSHVSMQDFVDLLEALENGFDFAIQRPPFPRLASILRAAYALSFTALYKVGSHILQDMWPADLSQLDTIPKPFAVETIALAEHCGVPGALKRAYYELLRTEMYGLVQGTMNDDMYLSQEFDMDDPKFKERVERLTQKQFLRLSFAREHLQHEWTRIIGRPPKMFECALQRMHPSEIANNSEIQRQLERCKIARSKNAITENWGKLLATTKIYEIGLFDALTGLDYLVKEDWKGMGFCKSCVEMHKGLWIREKQHLWAKLDTWLGLPPGQQ